MLCLKWNQQTITQIPPPTYLWHPVAFPDIPGLPGQWEPRVFIRNFFQSAINVTKITNCSTILFCTFNARVIITPGPGSHRVPVIMDVSTSLVLNVFKKSQTELWWHIQHNTIQATSWHCNEHGNLCFLSRERDRERDRDFERRFLSRERERCLSLLRDRFSRRPLRESRLP